LPYDVDASAHVFRDAHRVRKHLEGVILRYDLRTHSVRPVLPKYYHQQPKDRIPLKSDHFIVHAFWKAYDLLSEWVVEMARVRTLVPLRYFLDNRSRQALHGRRMVRRFGLNHIRWAELGREALVNTAKLRAGEDADKQSEILETQTDLLKAELAADKDRLAAWSIAETRLRTLDLELDDYWYKEAATNFALDIYYHPESRGEFDTESVPHEGWALEMCALRQELLDEDGRGAGVPLSGTEDDDDERVDWNEAWSEDFGRLAW
jgi:hypothetical protein